jgi:pilus assembly protein CpaE
MTIYCGSDAGAPADAPGRVASTAGLDAALAADPAEQLVVLGADVTLADALAVAAEQRVRRPRVGVVLVRDQVAVEVLAAAIRAGVREVVPVGDPDALSTACERSLALSRQLVPPAAPAATARGTVVSVFAGKGGCGKSTVATNLAVTLAGGGQRVLLVDLDLQFGDVAIMLGLDPERGISDAVAMAGRLDPDGVRSLLTRYRAGLDVLLAPAGPADADHITRDLVAELIGVARDMFDVVVVDTPPYFSDQVLATLDLTDRFVLVVTPDLPTLKSARLTRDMFDLLEYPADRRIAVLNRSDSDVGLSTMEIEKAVRMPMSVHVPSSKDVPVSINRGVPLAAERPDHPVSRAIRDLARRCVPAAPGPVGPARRGGLRLLRRKG